MPHPTGPTNPAMRRLALDLRKTKNKTYVDVARHIERPRRSKKCVNVGRLSKLSRKYSAFIVTGKVLGVGEVTKPISVYAWSFSKEARQKITKSGGKALPLKNIIKDKPEARLVV